MFVEVSDCIQECDVNIRPYENLGSGGRFQKGEY